MKEPKTIFTKPYNDLDEEAQKLVIATIAPKLATEERESINTDTLDWMFKRSNVNISFNDDDTLRIERDEKGKLFKILVREYGNEL